MYLQDCGLRKIRSPKVPNSEILGAKDLISLFKKY